MITLTYIFGAWALYLLGYAVGKARGRGVSEGE